jgi:hypothetical protein
MARLPTENTAFTESNSGIIRLGKEEIKGTLESEPDKYAPNCASEICTVLTQRLEKWK